MIEIKAVIYIPKSCLNLSEDAEEDLSNSDITWGSNDYSMVAVQKVLDAIDNGTEEDYKTLKDIIVYHGPCMMIDMEH